MSRVFYLLPHHHKPSSSETTFHRPRQVCVNSLFQTGSPSQVDTFDFKPMLAKRNGEKLAGADPKTGFFTTSGKCLGSPFKFNQHGESGAHISEILPNIARHADDIAFIYSCHSQSNNHTPAMLEMNSGMIRQDFPAWVHGLPMGSVARTVTFPLMSSCTAPSPVEAIQSGPAGSCPRFSKPPH